MIALEKPDLNIENELLIRFHSGDGDAFKQVFQDLCKPLCFFAEKILGQKEEAEDMVSLAFQKIWRNRPSFSSYSALRSYMYTTVKNNCLDQMEHQSVVERSHAEIAYLKKEATSYIESKMVQAEMLQLIYDAIRKLPEKHRNILEMNFLEELSVKEIAERLQLSESHVRADKSRALAYLRKNMTINLPICALLML